MANLNDDNGNLLGVTGLRKLDSGEWAPESVQGWVVYGNKFLLNLDGIEVALSAEAVSNILTEILETSGNLVDIPGPVPAPVNPEQEPDEAEEVPEA